MGFVHLHNHSNYSVLDAATRIDQMVKRAVELEMPALALTDHGYLFGIPEFDLECKKYNDAAADLAQWKSDRAAFAAGRTPEEPAADAADARVHDRAHAQWERDMAAWGAAHDLAAVDAARPAPVIKPIFGCETYFITDDSIEKKMPQHRYHLILLAKNETGYGNLMKMMSEAGTEQYYYRPRTTLEMLKRYHEGLICTSACVQGIIPWHIRHNEFDEAERWARVYQDIFGDDFYLEVQDHGLEPPEWQGWTDRKISERVVALGAKLGIKCVATNDNHYLSREDAPVQDILSCIGTASNVEDPARKKMDGQEFYIKSEEEMRALFTWAPEVIDNTLEVAAKCEHALDWSHMYLPKFPMLDPGETSEERFRKECEAGLAKRYGENWRERTIAGVSVLERFEFEYKIICEKGFADYFLIVQEYVRWAKENGIGVGPGRGSAAGAIVAYAMDITTFDPLENGLLFERFLSMERSEMPDIDMDFDDERRLEVVQHVRELYGADRVCHVITYHTIKARQAINDAARVLGYPVWKAQRLSKMISSAPNATLRATMERVPGREDQYSPDFVKAYEESAEDRQIIDSARAIEGLTRGEGVHACAVLITPTPVNDHVPTKKDTKGEDGVEITQYDGHTCADMGLLKMDFLGLRTLTVISKARANIRANYGIDIDPDTIPFDDPAIYELMGKGHTAGVFQIESDGMTAVIRGMRPREFKHVVALIALYRPGPLGAGIVTHYVDRMNGREEAVSYDERLSDILAETYGTLVYQEQVMQISVKMCGFSTGESDSRIRKPVAKKKIKLLTDTVFDWDDGAHETTYDHWMNGAERNGYARETAQRIWDDVLEFASYAFNKSHSAGYAILVMQTAWLKAHYPREYMASVLTSYMGKTEKIVHYVNACRREGITILPPDINASGKDFTAVPEGIRFGFAGIRGVGEGVGEAIIAEREAGGPFKNLKDFMGRLDSNQANRRVVEALIKAGAFDSTGYTRMQLSTLVDKNNPENLFDASAKRQKVAASGQFSLFDAFEGMEGIDDSMPAATGVEWDRTVKLAQEREVLGLYVSDHPLSPYEYALAAARDCTIGELDATEEAVDPETGAATMRPKIADGSRVRLAGMVSGVQKRVTKRGDQMAIAALEDMEGEVDLVIFPDLYKKCARMLEGEVDPETGESSGLVFIAVSGKFERGDRGDQMVCSDIRPLALNETTNRPHVLELAIPSSMFSRTSMDQLNGILSRYAGLDHVELRVSGADGVMRMALPVRVDTSNMVLLAELADMLGERGSLVVA